MPISVTCAECEARLNAPDAAAGETVKCPKCGSRMLVPATTGFEVVEKPSTKRQHPGDDDDEPRARKRRRDDDDEEDDDDRPRRKGKKKDREKSGVPMWVFAAVGGGVLAVGILVFVLVLGGNKDDKIAGGDSGKPGPVDGKLGTLGGVTVPDGWTEVNDPEVGFRVLVPGKVEKRNQPPITAKDRVSARWSWADRMGPAQTGPTASVRIVTLKDGTTPGSDPDKLFEEFGKLHAGGFAWGDLESKEPKTVGGKTGLVVRFKERVRFANQSEFRIDPNAPKEIQDSFREQNEILKKRVAEDRIRVEREGRRGVYLIVAGDDKKIYLILFETTGPVDEKTVTTIHDSFRLL